MTEPDTPAVDTGEAPADNVDTATKGDTRLATHLPHTLTIGGLTITPDGTAVPADEVDHVLSVAAAEGVPVYEMED